MKTIFNRKTTIWLAILILFSVIASSFISLSIVEPCKATSSGELPVVIDFRVYPSSIAAGDKAMISWNVANAQSISIDPGIGNLTMGGQLEVSPDYTTTYRITAVNDAGIRERFITLFVAMQQFSADDDVDCDPVTGRNASIDMSWEQLCLSSQYQVQIARDPAFTLIMYDSGSMQTADVTSPAFWYPPGNLEAGHTYYWRVRTTRAATGQFLLSSWSEIKPINIKSGFPVRSEYYGIHAFTPSNGCAGCPIDPVSFSWSGYQGTTKYRFVLARDSQLQDIVIEAFSGTTSYELYQPLEYDASYFWQVMAVEPVPSDPSPVFTFYTQSHLIVANETSDGGLSDNIPVWAMVVMVTGCLMVLLVLFLAFKARKGK